MQDELRPADRAARRRTFRVLAATLASALAVATGEGAVRLYLLGNPPRLRVDDALGWRTVEGSVRTETIPDAAGRRRRIRYTTEGHGFRAFGDPASRRTKVLFVGDSFTQAAAAADAETYFALAGRELDAEVFAYGAGGYGTLQELMILDRYLDEVRPDAVVLQFCTNDFINNDAALEEASRWDNNAMRRPYLEGDDRVSYRVPKPLAELRALGDGSRLVWALFLCWDRLAATHGHTVEQDIARLREGHEGFRRSIATTERLLRGVHEQCGRTPVFVFCADAREPYLGAARRIARHAGLTFLDGVPQAIEAEEHRGVVVRAADHAHWNDVGHRICAAELSRRLLVHPPFAHAVGPAASEITR